MTDSDIIRLAEQLLQQTINDACKSAVLAEREACAEVCDAYGMPDGTSETARVLAATIRARWQYD